MAGQQGGQDASQGGTSGSRLSSLSAGKPLVTPPALLGPDPNGQRPPPTELHRGPWRPNLGHPTRNFSATPSLRSPVWLCCLLLRAPPMADLQGPLGGQPQDGEGRGARRQDRPTLVRAPQTPPRISVLVPGWQCPVAVVIGGSPGLRPQVPTSRLSGVAQSWALGRD